MDDQAIEGAIIHSKEQRTELGETPTKYFYQLENKRQTRNSIPELRFNLSTVTSHKHILRECRDFYTKLYTAEPIDFASQEWLLNQLDNPWHPKTRRNVRVTSHSLTVLRPCRKGEQENHRALMFSGVNFIAAFGVYWVKT